MDDSVTVMAGRRRAQRMYPVIGACIRCGAGKAERHHVDGNTLNNRSSNIAVLCRKCHMELDGRLEEFQRQAKRRIQQTTEAAAIKRRSQTHCKRGHPLSGDNLIANNSDRPRRRCKTCEKARRKS